MAGIVDRKNGDLLFPQIGHFYEWSGVPDNGTRLFAKVMGLDKCYKKTFSFVYCAYGSACLAQELKCRV